MYRDRTTLGSVRRTVTTFDACGRGTVPVSGQSSIATGATARRRTRTVLATTLTHHRCNHRRSVNSPHTLSTLL